MTHICVSILTVTGSDNGLSPGRRQAIIWTNAGILLIGLLGTNFSENFIEILTFTRMRLKVSSAKWRPFCLGFNVLKQPVSPKYAKETSHYSYVKSSASRLSNNLFMVISKNTSKLRITGPLWWESAGHRWIFLTNDQQCDFETQYNVLLYRIAL